MVAWRALEGDQSPITDIDLHLYVIHVFKFYLVGLLFSLATQVNDPYGLTLLDDHIYWTDWYTDAVYRADANSGANIVLMVGNLGKPMDIHAYSAIQKQRKYVSTFYNDISNVVIQCYTISGLGFFIYYFLLLFI
jgi:hypothetical protein